VQIFIPRQLHVLELVFHNSSKAETKAFDALKGNVSFFQRESQCPFLTFRDTEPSDLICNFVTARKKKKTVWSNLQEFLKFCFNFFPLSSEPRWLLQSSFTSGTVLMQVQNDAKNIETNPKSMLTSLYTIQMKRVSLSLLTAQHLAKDTPSPIYLTMPSLGDI